MEESESNAGMFSLSGETLAELSKQDVDEAKSPMTEASIPKKGGPEFRRGFSSGLYTAYILIKRFEGMGLSLETMKAALADIQIIAAKRYVETSVDEIGTATEDGD